MLAASGHSAGVDEYREVAFEITQAGSVTFVVLKGDRSLPAAPIPGLEGARVTSVVALAKGRYVLGTSD